MKSSFPHPTRTVGNIVILVCFLVPVAVLASPKQEIKYKTSFGNCPPKTAGELAFALADDFEKNSSLRGLKNKMVSEALAEKYYLDEYEIKFDSLEKLLEFAFDCPMALMSVQLYRNGGRNAWNAVLVDNGKLFNPSYETVLLNEGKISKKLPSLAVSLKDVDAGISEEITQLMKLMFATFPTEISEVIINEENNLTVILSMQGHPMTAFFGSKEWEDKVSKLNRIVRYMVEQKKPPMIVNLVNSKKIVVKFPPKN